MNKKQENTWVFNGEEITSLSQMPEGTLGFIYKIYNLTTGKYYIGRKTCSSLRKRKLTAKEKLLPGNKRKTVIYEIKETSGWKNYCGSNEVLKEEIRKGDKVKREILHFCFTKAQITYLEVQEIVCSGALIDELSYNGWIKATIYKKYLLNTK
jgi:hypothetical protein